MAPDASPAPANPQAAVQPCFHYAQLDHAPLFEFTREQIDARFVFEQRKFEAELAAIEARTTREVEDSRARVAAIQAGAVPATASRNRVDKEEPVGGISPAALLVASIYLGLPKAEIARIFCQSVPSGESLQTSVSQKTRRYWP